MICAPICCAAAFRQITRDHSLVQELLEAGAIGPDEATKHPRGNVITRAVGAELDEFVLDKISDRLVPGDRFLLCSDGLCKTLPETIGHPARCDRRRPAAGLGRRRPGGECQPTTSPRSRSNLPARQSHGENVVYASLGPLPLRPGNALPSVFVHDGDRSEYLPVEGCAQEDNRHEKGPEKQTSLALLDARMRSRFRPFPWSEGHSRPCPGNPRSSDRARCR